MERTPAIYILASQKHGTLYSGVTSKPIERWWQHRNDVADGFTKPHGVKRLVHVEFFGDIEIAILREKQLKRWHRDWKIALIEQHNSGWRDLAPDYALEPIAHSRAVRMDAETSSA